MRPLRIEYPGAFYHVTSRGNERGTVFQGNRDRGKYLSYLVSAHERYGAVIHAYLKRRSPLRRMMRNLNCVNCFGESFVYRQMVEDSET